LTGSCEHISQLSDYKIVAQLVKKRNPSFTEPEFSLIGGPYPDPDEYRP